MLMPAVQASRNSARSAECKSNLRQIGMALDSYMDVRGSRAVYPDAAMLPSIAPKRKSIKEILGPHIEESDGVFSCPSDTKYFKKEGLSYEYPAHRLAGETREQVLTDRNNERRSSSEVWIVYDFDAFHGTPGQSGSRNFLYMDGHVDSE